MAEEKILNKEQQQAVEYSGGPLLIIAGAGTGKTTVITERIKHLIVEKKVSPTNILALTFTEKAAKEMQERVDVALPLGYANMWISTFHSFGDRILKNEIVNLGLTSRYSLLSEAEAVTFMKKHLAEFELDYFRPLGNPNKYLSDILKHFSRLKDENVTPNQYADWVKVQSSPPKADQPLAEKLKVNEEDEDEQDEIKKWQELSRVYEKYEELKNKQGLLDYGDLIYLVIRLFDTRPSVLVKYKKQFTHFLVDEFQDTNFAQYELVKLLAPPSGKTNLTIVADDNQSIYKFRGASVSNILDFNRDYPKAKSIVLNKNYRSSQTILDHAYQLIKFNDPDTLEAKLGISKKLEKQREVAEIDPEFSFFNRVEDEAEFVAKEIQSLVTGHLSLDYKDFAILVRANNHAEPFARALAYKGIPFQFLGPGLLFRQPEIKDLLAYLKLLIDYSDSVSAYRILSSKHFDLSGRTLAELNRYAAHEHMSLMETCEIADKLSLSEKDQKTLNEFVTMFHQHLDLAKEESAGQVLYHFLQDTDAVVELVKEENSKKSQNLHKFFEKIKVFESNREDKSIFALADYFDLAIELGESPMASSDDWVGNDAVNIITVHSAKGLEFPVVFMVNLVNARFPSTEKSDKVPLPDNLIKEHLPEGDFHLQEERRLFYVGMTRAKDRLYLLGSKFYNEEAKREKKPSPFVVEAMGIDRLQTTDYSLPQKSNQLSFLDFQTPSTIHRTPDTVHQTINSLSSSQIADFQLCPLKYYYKYILKIPLPQPPAGIFGSVIHDTLHDFYDYALKGEKVSSEVILNLYKDNWQTGGYESKHQRDGYFKQGIKYLTDYYNQSFNPKKLPILMEQTFGVKITENLKLTGRIDRIDLVENGIEIIDYKTGKPKGVKDLKKDFQLDLYALAVSLGGLRQPGVLDREYQPEEIMVSYYYFDNQQKVSFVKTKEDLKIAKQLVIDTAKEIESTDFRASSGMHCDYCEYKMICDYWK